MIIKRRKRLKGMSNKKVIDKILEEKNIQTVFQPVVSLKDGEILGYEALSRMDPAVTGGMATDKVFQLAFRCQKLWELETLCRKKSLENARQMDKNKKLFLNVSPKVIYDDHFKSGFTAKYLKKYDICPTNIVFELTEKVATKDIEALKESVSHYGKQGYETALDDMGAGYSGLNTIVDLNPTYLKIDMHIIRDIDKDNTKRALVKSFVQFAHNTGMYLVAEGVETREEMAVLIDLGVNYAQGYYLQKPDRKMKPLPGPILLQIKELNQTERMTDKNMVLGQVIKNSDIHTYIDAGDQVLGVLGFTEHSRVHAAKVSSGAGKILAQLGYSEKEIELARIAGYIHDIGNTINRTDHAHNGALMAMVLLREAGMDHRDIARIITAIGNHDEKTGAAVDPISAAVIIADKTDVRRNRVRQKEPANFDIHDRVNYAAVSTNLMINADKKVIHLDIELDDSICSVLDYFEIFLDRMLLCRRAAEKLGTQFKLTANGNKVL